MTRKVLRSVYSLIKNFIGLAWHTVYLSNTCDGVWSNGVGPNKETDKKHDEDCVEERFQLGRVKYDRDGEGSREALVEGSCSIKIGDRSELELA